MTNEDLVHAAAGAAKYAYSPYSGFKVGCVVVFDHASSSPHYGTNVENASYGLTICAERAAIFAAVAAGKKGPLLKLAIACRDKNNKPISCFQPCGACLQVINEFAGPDTEIILADRGVFKLHDFLPNAFVLPLKSADGSAA